jgi:hypothetical protein
MKRTRSHRRRGTGIAALILLLAVLNIAALGVLAAGSDESDLGVTRAQTLRAFYAAESGGVAVLRLSQESQTLPTQGSTLTLGAATTTYSTVTVSGTTRRVVVTGTSGDATRRVEVEFSVQ